MEQFLIPVLDFIRSHTNEVDAITALCGLFVSLLAIFLTVWSLTVQRRHNCLSLMPIASVLFSDYENDIAVTIKNTGMGPLFIDTFRATEGEISKDDLISWMPDLPEGMSWSNFIASIDGWCVPIGGEVVVLRLEGDSEKKRFALYRDHVRRALARLTVTVTYKDVYKNKMPPVGRSLQWFGRHFDASSA